jgi:glycosyltransferase involved in cell wall biosynthesis
MENELETLVILTPGFPKNEADTTCLPPQQIFVKALKEICPGLNIIVLTFQYPFYAAEYQWHGVKVISIGGKDKGRVFRMLTWQKVWLTLRKLNKNYKLIGLLSFWMGECAFVGDKFAKRHKLTHYSWLLGQDAKKGNKYFSWIKPQGESLIALSDFVAREVKKNYKITPVTVIPVGIDKSLFGTAPAKRDIDILGAGSLIPLKQYHLFIEVIAFLKAAHPDIKAVICGKGPEMEHLQELTATKGLSGNVLFIGELPHVDALALMQRAKVFLHPSNYEGFGAVLSEALYSGAHIVSFCKPMDKNYRHHYIVNDVAEMERTTLALLNSKKLDHEPVLMCPIEQIAKNMISLFVD